MLRHLLGQSRSNSFFTCSHATPGFRALRLIAPRSWMRSSMSSIRSCNRRISAASDFRVGFFRLATLLIGFLAISHSIYADQILFQCEKHSQVARSQPIFVCFRREFFHITGKVVLQRIKPSTDIPTLLFCQSSQLSASFLFNFKTVAHRSSSIILMNETPRAETRCNSWACSLWSRSLVVA